MAWIKGKPDNEINEDKLSNEFKALLIDIINDKHDKVVTNYFITIKSLLTLLVILTSIINALINDLTSYSLLH
jgi:hypothetical protein